MITADLFRQIMGQWATGVAITTTETREGQPYGLTVSSFTSVSLDPTLVLVCLDNRLQGLQYFKDAMKFGVSILSEAQEATSSLFAKKGAERPAEYYFKGQTGIPLIKGSLAVLECATVAIHPGGDHTIFIGQVEAAEVLEAAAAQRPLLYCRSRYAHLAD